MQNFTLRLSYAACGADYGWRRWLLGDGSRRCWRDASCSWPDAAATAAAGPPPPRSPSSRGGQAPWPTAALDRVARTRAAARSLARRRAELARLADSRTVRAALRRALLTGAIARPAHDRYVAALAGARVAARRLTGRSAHRAVGRPALRRAARGRAPPHAEPVPGGLPQPPPQHAHLDAGVVPARGRAPQLGRRSRRPAVRPGPRHAAAPARHLGQDQLAAAPLSVDARRLPRAQPAAPARRARAAAGAARRLRRLGVLLRVRAGHPAVDQRDGAGDRRPGALARGGRARRAALRAVGAAGARGVRDAAAGRRRGSHRGRPALRHVLLRAVAADPQRRAAGDQRPARRSGARAQPARGAARVTRRQGGAGGARRLRHGRLVALLGRGERVDARLPPAHHGHPVRALPAHGSRRVLPRGAPLRALPDRAPAGRDRPAARALGAPQRAAALHALEGLGGPGARVRPARARARARHAARPRRPRPELDAALARALPGARLGPRPGGPARQSTGRTVRVVQPRPKPKQKRRHESRRTPPERLGEADAPRSGGVG